MQPVCFIELALILDFIQELLLLFLVVVVVMGCGERKGGQGHYHVGVRGRHAPQTLWPLNLKFGIVY